MKRNPAFRRPSDAAGREQPGGRRPRARRGLNIGILSRSGAVPGTFRV